MAYRAIRRSTQSVLHTGHSGWGYTSTFGELNQKAIVTIADCLFKADPGAHNVLLDVGSGLGNVIFQSAIMYNVSGIGVEICELLFNQTIQLLTALIQRTPAFDPAQVMFIHRDAGQLDGLEGVTHLYSFNKNMPIGIFQSMARFANASSSLKFVCTYYDLRRQGWEDLELIKTVDARLSGSQQKTRMLIFRTNRSGSSPATTDTNSVIAQCRQRMAYFKTLSRRHIMDTWQEAQDETGTHQGSHYTNVPGTGQKVRRSTRQQGQETPLTRFYRSTLPSELVSMSELYLQEVASRQSKDGARADGSSPQG